MPMFTADELTSECSEVESYASCVGEKLTEADSSLQAIPSDLAEQDYDELNELLGNLETAQGTADSAHTYLASLAKEASGIAYDIQEKIEAVKEAMEEIEQAQRMAELAEQEHADDNIGIDEEE